MAILYSWLATSLRSIAIISTIYLHSYIYTHWRPHLQPYRYAARRWCIFPYTIIASPVNGDVSLTGFTSLPLFWQSRIRSQQFENALQHLSGCLLITRVLSFKMFILQSGKLTWAERISKMQSAVRRVTSQTVDNCYKSPDNSYTHPTRGNRIRSVARSTITIDCSPLSSTKQCRDRNWWERLYYPLTYSRNQKLTKSHQTMIFESTRLNWTIMCTCIPISWRLPLMVKVELQRWSCLGANSAYRDHYTMKVHNQRRSYLMAKLTYDENKDILTGYSMSIYDFGEYQTAMTAGFRSNKYYSCEIEFSPEYLPCYQCWWSLQRLQWCLARWLSNALRMLHRTPSSNSELL